GHYLTDTIYPPNFTTIMGYSGWGYQEAGGTVLSPVKPLQPRLIDLNGRIATRLIGLTLHGRDFGDDMTGVFLARGTGHEQNLIIDGCRIEHFSGCGVAMNESHVWHIRHSIIFANGKDGIDAS